MLNVSATSRKSKKILKTPKEILYEVEDISRDIDNNEFLLKACH